MSGTGAYADRVQETTATTGTGALTLAGAVSGYQSFSAGFAVGDSLYYCISDGGANWEVGQGVLTGASTLTRNLVLASSNSNALVSFAAGTKNVFCTLPAAAIADVGITTAIRGCIVPQ